LASCNLEVLRPRDADRLSGQRWRSFEPEHPGDRVRHGCGLRATRRCEEHRQGEDLQPETGSHGGLVGLGRIASSVGRPQGDDEAREALQAEGGAHVEDAEGGVGAA
jgi:hypothetical protein